MTAGGKTSRSAEIITFLRAVFSLPGSRPQLADTLAERFLRSALLRLLYRLCRGRLGRAVVIKAMGLALKDSYLYIPLRTAYIDAVLERELGGTVRQVLNLGAGYDTRGFRAVEKHPNVLYVELDLPATQAAKSARLKGHPGLIGGAVQLVPVDVRSLGWPEQLRETGFRDDMPTLVIAEGLLPYLTPPEAGALFEALASLTRRAERCVLVFTYLAKRTVSRSTGMRRILGWLHRPAGEPFASELDSQDLASWLQEQGFRLVEDLDFPSLCRMTPGLEQPPNERFPVPFRVALATSDIRKESEV